jgi:hypothetical protein
MRSRQLGFGAFRLFSGFAIIPATKFYRSTIVIGRACDSKAMATLSIPIAAAFETALPPSFFQDTAAHAKKTNTTG